MHPHTDWEQLIIGFIYFLGVCGQIGTRNQNEVAQFQFGVLSIQFLLLAGNKYHTESQGSPSPCMRKGGGQGNIAFSI